MTLVTLRPLERADFGLLKTWLETPHVARWWNHETTPDALQADFGRVLDGTDPAELFIALADGRPYGYLQRFAFADYPEYLHDVRSVLEVPTAACSIDYFVGEATMLRRGLGCAMIRAALDDLWKDKPAVPSLFVPVSTANFASMRVLERSGFRAAAYGALAPDNPVDGDRHVVYRIDRPLLVPTP